ncbi:Catechol 2,3-dioxygenase [Gracilibacillus ureilyticus]|uniref:Catechol 2,3-dioxygenase n=1 Tax=Gracilibacillus ureilyticus TaxID=531814 RepID=A0A1H9Q591_9BACI|nr:VOC family protein [Gracilibacillus ureilyticus]SER55588.1 Catechol 2,3-dioxygenase [Gracilibacillus ureilyticus]
MNIKSFYPVLMSEDVELTSDFYKHYFGFNSVFQVDWYTSLRQEKAGYELAIIDKNHQTIPAQFSKHVQGLILNFEVENVDEVYANLIRQAKLPLHMDIRDEEFGQRHFITSDPDGVLIDIIKIIPPSQTFHEHYKESIWMDD